MQNPKHLNLLINAAAAATAVVVIGYMAYSATRTETEAPCSTRYPSALQFPLTNASGAPLTSAELQARGGALEYGLRENASVVAVDGAPTPQVLEVQLRGVDQGAEASFPRTGIGFHWTPPGMNDALSACITYSAWVPDKFDFSSGGVLPGVFGGVPGAAAKPVGEDTTSARPGWNSTGAPTVGIIAEDKDRGRVTGSGSRTMVTSDHWSRIEQEVVLNGAGKPDGIVRLWIDGKLVAENKHLDMRTDPKTKLQGVLFSVGYARIPAQPGVLRLTPIEISWRQ